VCDELSPLRLEKTKSFKNFAHSDSCQIIWFFSGTILIQPSSEKIGKPKRNVRELTEKTLKGQEAKIVFCRFFSPKKIDWKLKVKGKYFRVLSELMRRTIEKDHFNFFAH